MSPLDAVLVLNVGSSSVKFRVFAAAQGLPLLADGRVTGLDDRPILSVGGEQARALPAEITQKQALRTVLDWIEANGHDWHLVATGHRIVHGGTAYYDPVVLDDEVLGQLDRYVRLAPLHQPHGLAAVRAVRELYPHLVQVGCFDTAFHAGHDELTYSFALPRELRDTGIRRYGFHGLSYEWIGYVLGREENGIPERVVAAHLGNGASLCAMRWGKSVDTTMGMTALEGLPMGTRSGSLDPGAIFHMVRECGLGLSEVEDILYNQSGLRGLSGGISDMRELLASQTSAAALAVAYFVRRTAQFVAQMAVSLRGLDLLVFTGGIGENAVPVREAIIEHLSFLPPFAVRVIEADEERMIARHALRLLTRLDRDVPARSG